MNGATKTQTKQTIIGSNSANSANSDYEKIFLRELEEYAKSIGATPQKGDTVIFGDEEIDNLEYQEDLTPEQNQSLRTYLIIRKIALSHDIPWETLDQVEQVEFATKVMSIVSQKVAEYINNADEKTQKRLRMIIASQMNEKLIDNYSEEVEEIGIITASVMKNLIKTEDKVA
jgi:hypothetical protein